MKEGHHAVGTISSAVSCGNSQSRFGVAWLIRASGPPRSIRQYTSEKISTFVAHTAMLEVRSVNPDSVLSPRTIWKSRNCKLWSKASPVIKMKTSIAMPSIRSHRLLSADNDRATIGTISADTKASPTQIGNTLTRAGRRISNTNTATTARVTSHRDSVRLIWFGSSIPISVKVPIGGHLGRDSSDGFAECGGFLRE